MKKIQKCTIFSLTNLLKIQMEITIKMSKKRLFMMVQNMKVNYMTTEDKVKEYTIIKMEICIWVTGKMISSTVKEFIFFPKEIDMRVN